MNNRGGFSLIELVMTIVIASLVLYSLLAVFITAAGRNVHLESYTIALYLANSKLETVGHRSFGQISSEALASFGGSFGDFFSQVAVINVSSEALDTAAGSSPTGYKKITVFVSSSLMNGASLEASTLVTDVSNP